MTIHDRQSLELLNRNTVTSFATDSSVVKEEEKENCDSDEFADLGRKDNSEVV